jgi:predicted membrane channel-forming protein YqfA (hemolysin III family)
MAPDAGSGRQETDTERLDRNLGELLQELRVALPGVQVLFAFLLTIPFNQRFVELTPAQERIYLATLLSTTISAVLLIAPTAYHRLTFRRQQKRELVRLANWMAIAGLAFLAVAMTGVVLLVTDFLFGRVITVVCTAGAGLMFAIFWYALPLRRRLSLRDEV